MTIPTLCVGIVENDSMAQCENGQNNVEYKASVSFILTFTKRSALAPCDI